MKINIREQLNNIDRDTYCKYDLVNLYESVNRTTDEKKRIAKALSEGVSPAKLNRMLSEDLEEEEICGYSVNTPLILTFDDFETFMKDVVNEL